MVVDTNHPMITFTHSRTQISREPLLRHGHFVRLGYARSERTVTKKPLISCAAARGWIAKLQSDFFCQKIGPLSSLMLVHHPCLVLAFLLNMVTTRNKLVGSTSPGSQLSDHHRLVRYDSGEKVSIPTIWLEKTVSKFLIDGSEANACRSCHDPASKPWSNVSCNESWSTCPIDPLRMLSSVPLSRPLLWCSRCMARIAGCARNPPSSKYATARANFTSAPSLPAFWCTSPALLSNGHKAIVRIRACIVTTIQKRAG